MELRIEVNPFYNSSKVFCQNSFYVGGRVYDFINEKPMSDWLKASRSGYQIWDGFFAELVKELNDDDIKIVFIGTSSDWQHFNAAILEQSSIIEDYGFSAENITLEFIERFSVLKARELLLRLRDNMLKLELFPYKQDLILAQDRYDKTLREKTDISAFEIFELINGYVKICTDCIANSDEALALSWQNYRMNLLKIIK